MVTSKYYNFPIPKYWGLGFKSPRKMASKSPRKMASKSPRKRLLNVKSVKSRSLFHFK